VMIFDFWTGTASWWRSPSAGRESRTT
jgi:hypothetical protein